MAVTFHEKWSGDESDGKSAKRVWIVVGTSNIEEARLIVPGYGLLWDKNPSLGLIGGRPSATRVSPQVFEVTVAFTKVSSNSKNTDGSLDKRTKYRWNYSETSEPIDRDLYNQIISNSSGEPFEPNPTDEKALYNLAIERWEDDFDIVVASGYADMVNSGDWKVAGKIVKKGMARAIGFIPADGYALEDCVPGERNLLIHYNFAIRERGWQLRLLDQGYRRKVKENGKTVIKENIDPKTGSTYTKQKLLNGFGDFFGNNQGAGGCSNAKLERLEKANFLIFTIKGERDFNVLNFDISAPRRL